LVRTEFLGDSFVVKKTDISMGKRHAKHLAILDRRSDLRQPFFIAERFREFKGVQRACRDS